MPLWIEVKVNADTYMNGIMKEQSGMFHCGDLLFKSNQVHFFDSDVSFWLKQSVVDSKTSMVH